MNNHNLIRFNLLLSVLLSFNSILQSQDQSCLSFDGLADRVTVPLLVSQSLNSDDFTIEARISGLESENSNGTILSNRTDTNTGFHLFIHDYWGGSDHQMLCFRYNGINRLYINNGDFDGKLLDGDCHHIAISKVGDVLSFFIDGILIGFAQNQPNLDISTNIPMLIGTDSFSGRAFNGNINDVRIWNVGRNQSEIEEGVKNEIDPNANGLIGYWKMNEGAGQTISDLTNQNDAVLGSGSSSESNDPSWGNLCCEIPDPESNKCLSFDGLNDQVSIPTQANQSLITDDFTFEARISGLEGDNSNGTILSNRTGDNSGFHLFIHDYWNGSNHQMLSLRYNNTNWLFNNNGNYNGKLLDGNCHHIAVSKEGSDLSFYIDGTLIGVRANQPNINISTSIPMLIGSDPHSGNSFNGTINDVRIWNVGRNQSEIEEGVKNEIDPNANGLIGYWKMNEGAGQTISDLTNQNDAVLGSGSSSESNDPSWGNLCCEIPDPESNKCLSFDGLNDQVSIPTQANQSLITDDFTFEARISGLEGDNSNGTILSNRTGDNSGFHLFIHDYWNGSNHQMLSLRYNNTNWLFNNNGNYNGKLLDGNCHHIAVSKEGSDLSFYIDGTLIGVRANQPNINISTSIPMLIGSDPHSGNSFNGTINDVRIWNVGRNQSEIEEGVKNEIDPNANGLIGYWKMNEGAGQTISDLTNQNDAVLGSGSSSESNDPSWGNLCCEIPDPESNKCLSFDGLNDQVSIPTQANQSLITDDFTFEARISGLEGDNSNGTILSNRTGDNSGFHLFIHDYWNGSNHQMLSLRYNNTNWLFNNNGNYNGKLLDGNCHHIAVSKEGSDLSFYIDGTLIGVRANQPNINISTSIPMLIGSDPHSGNSFNGTINDVRIWNVGRNQSEIEEGVKNEIDPNANGLIGYWKMNEGAGQTISDLTNQNDAVLGSGSSSESNDPSWGNLCCEIPDPESNKCLSFDGLNDQVSIPTQANQSLITDDFTFEARISGLEGDNSNGTILSNRTGDNSGFHLFIHDYWNGSNHQMLSLRYNNTNWLFNNNGNYNGKLLDGNCHHIAVSKVGSDLSFYIDGTLIGVRANQPNINISTSIPMLIGSDPHSGNSFNGTINDVRIWNVGRNQSEIEEGVKNEIDPNANGLIGYWKMNEGAGQTISDLTNQNDAVLGSGSSSESNDPSWGNLCCDKGIVLDINELKKDNHSLLVYPNPSEGVFTIDLKNNFIANKYQYTLYDNMGRIIEYNSLSTPTLDFRNINAGQYFIQISTSQEILGISKLVIIK